jgi:type IV secretory pathway TrbL component
MDARILEQLPMVLTAVAGVITALAGLVWAFRRKP